jgi:pantoate--beta-alanine ligase
MRDVSARWRSERESIGFVATMGALHEGHLSLVRRSRAENARTVVSIFVNPLQFGPNEDFDRYPRDQRRDLSLLAQEAVDAVYLPSVSDMYPETAETRVHVGRVADVLEGESRPGFFDGVATVVAKLFNTVLPDVAYFGEKDAQQVAVVSRLAADLDFGVEVRACPIVREPDGLALSSRNVYLNPAERQAALCLVRALRTANDAFLSGEHDAAQLESVIWRELEREPLASVDYATIVHAATFAEPRTGSPLRALLAVRIGKTRLIDNHVLGRPLD